jgi:hypothetical protein
VIGATQQIVRPRVVVDEGDARAHRRRHFRRREPGSCNGDDCRLRWRRRRWRRRWGWR